MTTQTVITVSRKETGFAYLWWLFLGVFGGHRFYLGYNRSAIAMLLLCWTLIVPFVMCLIDLFMIPSMTRAVNNQQTLDARNDNTQ